MSSSQNERTLAGGGGGGARKRTRASKGEGGQNSEISCEHAF